MPANDDSNLVEPSDGCPICGERDADRLVWIDDETIQCTMCGCEYRPAPGTEGAHVG